MSKKNHETRKSKIRIFLKTRGAARAKHETKHFERLRELGSLKLDRTPKK